MYTNKQHVFVVLTIIMGSLVGLLSYEHYYLRSLVVDLQILKSAYQERINQHDEFVTQQRFLMLESNVPFLAEVDTEEWIPLNRNLDYLQSNAYDFFKIHKLEQLWSSVVRGLYQQGSNQSYIAKKVPIKHKKSHLHRQGLPLSSNAFLQWPIKTNLFWVSSLFGKRKNKNGTIGFHYGIDLAALKGTFVHAAADGVVVDACSTEGYGNLVIIKHTPRLSTRYAHLHTIETRIGKAVKRGEIIGRVGETGFIRKRTKDGSHLHFEVCDDRKRINPLLLLTGL